jgi:hypothetical protein
VIAKFKHTDMKKKLMHWWGEGMSGIAFAFIKAYVCEVTPACKHSYKHYATGALLLTNFVLNYHIEK